MTSLSSVNNFENNGCPHISKQVAEQLNTQNANNKIPLVDLKSNYNRMKKEIDASIADVLQSCYFIGSPHVKQFEKNFATFIGTKHCIGVNSGTDALILAMKFLGIGPGDEVIVQANTFIATYNAIKFTQKGEITVSAKLLNDEFHLTVSDTGSEGRCVSVAQLPFL